MDALVLLHWMSFFLHDPGPGPSLSRCIISVKYCSQGIPKASFYKGDVSSCVLVEQKLTSVKFRRYTLNVVINDQRNESQRNSNLTRSIVAAKNEGLSKEGGQMVSTLSTPSTLESAFLLYCLSISWGLGWLGDNYLGQPVLTAWPVYTGIGMRSTTILQPVFVSGSELVTKPCFAFDLWKCFLHLKLRAKAQFDA